MILRLQPHAYKGEMALTCIEKCHDALENLQNDILVILNELNTIYMTTRYPDEIEIIEKSLDDEETTRIFTETKRIFSWLEEKLHKK